MAAFIRPRALDPILTTVCGLSAASKVVGPGRSCRILARQGSSGSISGAPSGKWELLEVEEPKQFVRSVKLNRPEKLNALDETLWREIGECFQALGQDPDCRAIVLSGNGKAFSSGIDLGTLGKIASLVQDVEGDLARKARAIYPQIRKFQLAFLAIEECPKPVIAAIHGACVGGATNLVSFCDIRYCTKDAWFQVREAELGFAADVGVLQQLPKAIGSQSLARELCLTARKFEGPESLQCGFSNRMFETKDEMMEFALDTAGRVAGLSPVGVQGTKLCLNHSRDRSVEEGLEYIARHNSVMLQSEDVMKGAMALITKSKAEFDKL